ncbi:hypothetical protein N7467_011263 [Penicillium canescens]|nr:hypothetical protein N7467_011263 [Penicillium canescens]
MAPAQLGDFDHFEKLRSGPNFELRLAGGAYRFHKNEPRFWELLVDSKYKKIYVDGNLVENQAQDETGSILFTYSEYQFKVKFEVPWILGEKQPDRLQFSGTFWKQGENETKGQKIKGHRCFPWQNAFDLKQPTTNENIPSSQEPSPDVLAAASKLCETITGNSYSSWVDLIDSRRPKKPLPERRAVHLLPTVFATGMGDILIMATAVILSAVAFTFQRPSNNINDDNTWKILVSGLVGRVATLLMNNVHHLLE